MNKIGAKRLLRLADLLDDVPVKEFSIQGWSQPCGTVACAIGHACISDKFEGLSLTSFGHFGVPVLTGREENGWQAVSVYFSLKQMQSHHLFSYASYSTSGRTRPKTVANRIRKFVGEQA